MAWTEAVSIARVMPVSPEADWKSWWSGHGRLRRSGSGGRFCAVAWAVDDHARNAKLIFTASMHEQRSCWRNRHDPGDRTRHHSGDSQAVRTKGRGSHPAPALSCYGACARPHCVFPRPLHVLFAIALSASDLRITGFQVPHEPRRRDTVRCECDDPAPLCPLQSPSAFRTRRR